MSALPVTASELKESRQASIARLTEQAAKIRQELTSNSSVSLLSDHQNAVLAKNKTNAAKMIEKNLAGATAAVRDATVRLNSISELLTRMLTLSSQVDPDKGSVYSDRMFQSLLRDVEKNAFSAKAGVFNLLVGGSGMYVEVSSQSANASRYANVAAVNIGEMVSFGFLSGLTINSSSSAREAVSKLTTALQLINNGRSVLKANQILIDRYSNETTQRLKAVENPDFTLTARERNRLSSELASVQSHLNTYKVIDWIVG